MIVRWFSYSLFHSLPLFIGPGICSKGGRISLYVKVLFTLLVDSLFAGSLSSCDGEPYGKDLRAAFRNCDHTTPKNSGSVIRHRKGRNTTMKMTNTWCQEVYFGGGKDDSARATLPEYLSLIPSTHTVLRTVCNSSSSHVLLWFCLHRTCVCHTDIHANKTRHIK